jgi:hypothetical protein
LTAIFLMVSVASWLNVRPSIFMVRPLIFRKSEHCTFSVLCVGTTLARSPAPR